MVRIILKVDRLKNCLPLPCFSKSTNKEKTSNISPKTSSVTDQKMHENYACHEKLVMVRGLS